MQIKLFLNRYLTRILIPPNLSEDNNRRVVILNILLYLSIAAFIFINIIRIIDRIIYSEIKGIPLWSTILILFFLLWLAKLSKHGKIKLASVLLITLFSLPMVFSLVVWGADLPAGLLLSVFIITMSVALLGASSAFSFAFLFSALLISLTSLQNQKIIIIQDYWRQETNQIADAIVYSILLLLSAGIAWIFAHSTEQSLARARKSEKALEEEKNSLEIKVQERTLELRRAEQEKLNQLYRFAEFGKLSSGIFHDLINPLTAVSLNLEQINDGAKSENTTDEEIIRAKSYLHQALLAANKMEKLISGVKKQIQKDNETITFAPNKEISEIIQILAFKSRKAGVEINFTGENNLTFTGDSLKFSQIIINLLANAIDASEDSSKATNIEITLKKQNESIIITVKDQGSGIHPENIVKIYEPFFSTKKKTGQGLGIGLAMTKDIIERTFNGTISVSSILGKGTIFIVTLPLATLPLTPLARS